MTSNLQCDHKHGHQMLTSSQISQVQQLLYIHIYNFIRQMTAVQTKENQTHTKKQIV